jgi:predicted phage-related endonuclease
MKKNWYTRPKPEHGTAEWLKARWKNGLSESQITASVAGVVHGAHPWVSAADLAIELLAKTAPEPKPTNEAMERGNRLEPTLIKWVADRLDLVLVTPEILYCYEENGVRLMATLDAVSLAEPGYSQVFEVKTTSKRWNNKLPDYWYWQGVQQAICANVWAIDWAIFDSNLELHHYVQKVTSDEKELHIQACREFLAAIDCGMMPENAHPEYKHVSAIYPQSSDKSVEIPTEMMDKLKSLDAIKKQIKDFETLEDQIKTEICGLMGEAEYAQVGGTTVATWKTSTRTSLDQKKLEQDHPALVEKYRKQSTVRTFRAKL